MRNRQRKKITLPKIEVLEKPIGPTNLTWRETKLELLKKAHAKSGMARNPDKQTIAYPNLNFFSVPSSEVRKSAAIGGHSTAKIKYKRKRYSRWSKI